MGTPEWFDVPLDKDGVIISQVIVTLVVVDGGTRYGVSTRGNSHLSTMLGLLEMAKHDLLLENDDDSAK